MYVYCVRLIRIVNRIILLFIYHIHHFINIVCKNNFLYSCWRPVLEVWTVMDGAQALIFNMFQRPVTFELILYAKSIAWTLSNSKKNQK